MIEIKNMRSRIVVCLLLVILTVTLSSGCAQTEEKALTEKKKLKIGVLVPLTGRFQTAGVYMTNAAKLAEKHLEEEGLDVELEFADCGDSAEKTKAAFLELVDRVDAVVGAYSSPQAIAAAETAKETETIYIVTVASTDLIERKVAEGNRWVFRNAYNTSYWGDLAFEFLRLSNAEAYYFQGYQPLTTFNKGMLNAISQKTDLRIIDEVYYNPTVDPKDVQNKALEATKKVGERNVLILGDPGSLSVAFLKAYRNNGGKGIVYSVGGVLALPQVLRGLNETADYTAFQAAALESVQTGKYTKKYFEDYKREFGEEANNYAGVLTYDAILILGQAAQKGDLLIEDLEKGEFHGACGVYEFNERHQAKWGTEKLRGKIAEWVKGKTLILYPPAQSTSEVVWP
jgi:branched-chain amino acid transport system substrate-binding protein